MKARTAVGCVMVLAATVATAGCSASQVDKAAESVSMIMQRVAHNADGKQSAQVDFVVDLNGKHVQMSGTYAWGSHAGLDVRMKTAELGMQALTSADTVEMRFVDGAYYYAVGPRSSGPLKGKHWMKVDASAVFGDASALDSGMQQNPTVGLDALSASDDATRIGTETVDGKQTTHYSATVSKSDLSKNSKLFSEQQKGALAKYFGGSDSVTTDVWVDGHDLPVRLTEDFGSTKVTIDFQSFGGAHPIPVPPAADTADVSAAVKAKQKAATTA